jgi:diaminopimelate epimerase
MKFSRYHALGNDYIVMEASGLQVVLSPAITQRICHRHYGVGSDGILVHQPSARVGAFKLQILNPDGSEAEKSGNGLRIFARYLFDTKLVNGAPFQVDTIGGTVTCLVKDSGRSVTVDMGTVSFQSDRIPVAGAVREVINEELILGDRTVQFCAATVGNPHCVVLNCEVSAKTAKELGPLLEVHPNFPKRTNVQFLRVIDRKNIALEIWERGAGYTLASGSSSCAAAAVAYRLGLVDPTVTVQMPGGRLSIEIGKDLSIRMSGPVTKIACGVLDQESLADLL